MYNNLDIKRDKDDMKFIPLNVMEPFIDKNSNWVPNIDLTLPNFNNIPEGFVLGFGSPIDNSNLQGAPLKTLDFMQNNNLNMQDFQNKQEFEQDFDLYYPSETLGEELYSYNKNEKCKNNNSTNKEQGTYKNNTNWQNGNMNNPNNNANWQNGNMNNSNNNLNWQSENTNNLNNNQNWQSGNMNNSNNNLNGQNMNSNQNSNMCVQKGIENNNENMPIIQNRSSEFQEPIHMELLRNLDFQDYLGGGFRGEDNNIKGTEDIFTIIKDDKSIIDTFKAYNIPKPIYEMIIKKIIIITLENSKYKRGE